MKRCPEIRTTQRVVLVVVVVVVVALCIYTVSQKTTLMYHTITSDADQPILIIFGRDVAERVCLLSTVICYPTSPN